MKQRFGDQLWSWAILSRQNYSLGICKGQLGQVTFWAPSRFILSVNVYQTPVRTELTDAGLHCPRRPSGFLPEFRTNWVKDIEVRKIENCNIATIIEKHCWGYKGNRVVAFLTPTLRIKLIYSSVFKYCWTITGSPNSECCGDASPATLQHGEQSSAVGSTPRGLKKGRHPFNKLGSFSHIYPGAWLLPLPVGGEA